MGWKLDLVVYAILFLIFVLRKEKGKKISMLISVIFASISCVIYLENIKYMLIPHIAIGLLSVVLLFFVERRNPITLKKNRSKVAGGFLSLFLGSFGIHGFYLGHWAWACLYLLFWWTYIPMVIGMVEGIVIFILPKQLFERLYCVTWFVTKTSKASPKKESKQWGSEYTESNNELFEENSNSSYNKDEFDIDKVEYSNISLHETKSLKTANIKGCKENFTIVIDTELGPIHFLVQDGRITYHCIESKNIVKQYEVN